MFRFAFKFMLLVTMANTIVECVDSGMAQALDAIHDMSSANSHMPVVDSSPRVGAAVASMRRSLYESANEKTDGETSSSSSYEQESQVSYEDVQNNEAYQEWKESSITDEEKKQQEEEAQRKQEEYEQQQQKYEEQVQAQEMEKYQEYLEWKWNMTEAGQLDEDNQELYGYGEDENGSRSGGLSSVDSDDLSKGKQFLIGSSMLLVGMIVGFGVASLRFRQKHKMTPKTRPLMDDPKADMA